jgi:ribosomal RNA assembly protein
MFKEDFATEDFIAEQSVEEAQLTLVKPTGQSAEQEFSYEIKIPQERVAVLIGKDGEIKKEIENFTQSNLEISEEGDVVITGKDSILLFTAREVVHAIARGFNPKIALLLLKTDFAFEVLNITDVVGKSKGALERMRGRLIGTGGKSREEIERLTETYISIYGKTVGIIGEISNVALAHQAIGMILDGAMHKTVYRFLEKKKKEQLFG